MKLRKRGFLIGITLCLMMLLPMTAMAAEGDVAQVPVHVELNGTGAGSAKAEMLAEQDNYPMPEDNIVTTDANGDAAFSISFSGVGNYKYTVRQIVPEPKEEGVTYDETVYVVLISTVYDSNGNIVPQVSIHKEDSEDKTDAVSFSNTKKQEEPKPELIDITVRKVWDDANDQDKIRPASVTIELLADGTPTGDTLTLNKENQWSGSFTGLAKEKDSKEVTYTVREKEVEGYKAAISGNADTGFTVTNTHSPKQPPANDNHPSTRTDTPRTGDPTNLALWSTLLAVSAAALIFSGIVLRKKKQEEK